MIELHQSTENFKDHTILNYWNNETMEFVEFGIFNTSMGRMYVMVMKPNRIIVTGDYGSAVYNFGRNIGLKERGLMRDVNYFRGKIDVSEYNEHNGKNWNNDLFISQIKEMILKKEDVNEESLEIAFTKFNDIFIDFEEITDFNLWVNWYNNNYDVIAYLENEDETIFRNMLEEDFKTHGSGYLDCETYESYGLEIGLDIRIHFDAINHIIEQLGDSNE